MQWLRKLFGLTRPSAEASTAKTAAAPDVRVSHDETSILLHHPDGREDAMAWSAIVRVAIETTDSGPFAADLFWIVDDSEGRRLTIPLEADGESELLAKMQRRLDGFDNMAVVEAMGSTEMARFTVWEAKQN
ncbi:MAG: hypothetical protein ACT4N2_09740 [Hyphomicrobium sp.]